MNKITVKNISVSVESFNNQDYICITDMIKAKDGDFFVSDWLRNRNTVEFLSIWEKIHNPHFNYGEYATIRNYVGLNNYKLSIKEWIKKTNAIGIKAFSGRYGGTYAHKDLAFEFGMWVSPEFKLYLIKEFERLKEKEYLENKNFWNISREFAKINHALHTDAIKENLLPPKITKKEAQIIYSSEADLLNKALFGYTAKEWNRLNSSKEGNLRDYASMLQLIVLANLESLNSVLIQEGLSADKRIIKLNEVARKQVGSLQRYNSVNWQRMDVIN